MHGRESYLGLHEPGDTYNWAGAKILAPWDNKLLSQDGSCTHRMGIRPCTCTVLPCWMAARTPAGRGAPDASIRGAPC